MLANAVDQSESTYRVFSDGTTAVDIGRLLTDRSMTEDDDSTRGADRLDANRRERLFIVSPDEEEHGGFELLEQSCVEQLDNAQLENNEQQQHSDAPPIVSTVGCNATDYSFLSNAERLDYQSEFQRNELFDVVECEVIARHHHSNDSSERDGDLFQVARAHLAQTTTTTPARPAETPCTVRTRQLRHFSFPENDARQALQSGLRALLRLKAADARVPTLTAGNKRFAPDFIERIPQLPLDALSEKASEPTRTTDSTCPTLSRSMTVSENAPLEIGLLLESLARRRAPRDNACSSDDARIGALFSCKATIDCLEALLHRHVERSTSMSKRAVGGEQLSTSAAADYRLVDAECIPHEVRVKLLFGKTGRKRT